MRKLGFVFLVSMLCGISQAAVLKIATVTPEGSQWMKEMRAGAKEISERTDGRVQIKYYGGGVMGNDTKVLGKIRIGALQGGAFTPTALMERYTDINLYGLPLIFDTEDEAAYVRERLDARLEKGLEDAGFVNFGFAAGGFALLMSNKPVRGLDDLRGRRVWVPEGDTVSYASMEALQLSPVTLPLTDVLTGLQTGLIDIVAMSPIGALVLQWHTKVKYITELPLVYTMGVMAIDKRVFEKISAEDQAVVREVMTRTYVKLGKDNLIDNEAAKQALLDTGIQAVVPDAREIAEIREVLRQSNRKLGEQGMFSIDLYNEMISYVNEYRRDNGGAAAGK
jgi:TRAP-type C4-dicarboxylate transport system substrate-binding protein